MDCSFNNIYSQTWPFQLIILAPPRLAVRYPPARVLFGRSPTRFETGVWLPAMLLNWNVSSLAQDLIANEGGKLNFLAPVPRNLGEASSRSWALCARDTRVRICKPDPKIPNPHIQTKLSLWKTAMLPKLPHDFEAHWKMENKVTNRTFLPSKKLHHYCTSSACVQDGFGSHSWSCALPHLT